MTRPRFLKSDRDRRTIVIPNLYPEFSEVMRAVFVARGYKMEIALEQLNEAMRAATGGDDDLRELSVTALIGRIVDRHHAYLRSTLPFLEPLAAKVAAVHGDHNPNLIPVRDTLAKLTAMLEPHLVREERELFPMLMAGKAEKAGLTRELESMRAEHLQVGATLHHLREVAEGFAIPEWACRSYRALMAELERLESDILRHVHIENHVLAPKVTAGERGEA